MKAEYVPWHQKANPIQSEKIETNGAVITGFRDIKKLTPSKAGVITIMPENTAFRDIKKLTPSKVKLLHPLFHLELPRSVTSKS